MSENDVDIVELQALERALEALDEMLLAQAVGIGLLATGAKEDLWYVRKDECQLVQMKLTFVWMTYSSLGQSSSFKA